MDAEIGEGGEVILVDRFPETQFSGDSAVEVMEYVKAISALGRRCKPQQLDRP